MRRRPSPFIHSVTRLLIVNSCVWKSHFRSFIITYFCWSWLISGFCATENTSLMWQKFPAAEAAQQRIGSSGEVTVVSCEKIAPPQKKHNMISVGKLKACVIIFQCVLSSNICIHKLLRLLGSCCRDTFLLSLLVSRKLESKLKVKSPEKLKKYWKNESFLMEKLLFFSRLKTSDFSRR